MLTLSPSTSIIPVILMTDSSSDGANEKKIGLDHEKGTLAILP